MKGWCLFTFSTVAFATHVQQRDCNDVNCLRAIIEPATASTTSLSEVSQIASRIPVVHLIGDSTMALDGGNSGSQGWGEYLKYSIDQSKAVVNNSAVAGRSARSYTREGRFAALAKVVNAGDWVIIEFGHNDGGSPYPASADIGRADCPGSGNETCPTVYANATEIVLTYPAYLIAASKLYLALGAKVILSAPTPDNPWETGSYNYTLNRFTYYAALAVEELGGPAAGAYFVSHGEYAAQAMFNLGPAIVDANYPVDHTHTYPYLAGVVSQSFVLGVKCGTAPLQDWVVNATARIEGPILGDCIPVNATLPV